MLVAAPIFMKQYYLCYSLLHVLKVEAPDIVAAERRARGLVAQLGPRAKLVSVRDAFLPMEGDDLPKSPEFIA